MGQKRQRALCLQSALLRQNSLDSKVSSEDRLGCRCRWHPKPTRYVLPHGWLASRVKNTNIVCPLFSFGPRGRVDIEHEVPWFKGRPRVIPRPFRLSTATMAPLCWFLDAGNKEVIGWWRGYNFSVAARSLLIGELTLASFEIRVNSRKATFVLHGPSRS